MHRIGAIFVAACMVIVAGSLGTVLYLGLRLDLTTSIVLAFGALVVLALYDGIGTHRRDRSRFDDHIADLSRRAADLAGQITDISRRLKTLERRLDDSLNARDTAGPLAVELGELGDLVRQLANTVASHEAALQTQGAPAEPSLTSKAVLALREDDVIIAARGFPGKRRAEIVNLIGQAIEANRIDLYLQPTVTLPQRKIRYYEALSRLRLEDSEVVVAGDFLEGAEVSGLMPKLDNLLLFRCVQLARRFQAKNRDVGLFCNLSPATLNDPGGFKQLLDIMRVNRSLAGAIIFEFKQNDYRAFGPVEREALAALAECGFRFSLDHVTDLRTEPKGLAQSGVRFLKVPAKLLLSPSSDAHKDIHPEDFADLLARFGINLIAERIESESTVRDLLDYDVRFGQGFLFSAPRPVRTEALQGVAAADGVQPAELAAAVAHAR